MQFMANFIACYSCLWLCEQHFSCQASFLLLICYLFSFYNVHFIMRKLDFQLLAFHILNKLYELLFNKVIELSIFQFRILIVMEVSKKGIHNKQQRNSEKLTQEFFHQVFSECKRVFDKKQFDFFSMFIIPHYSKNQSNSLNNQSKNPNMISLKEDDIDINNINPHLLTQPRRQNFYAEHSSNQITKQKQNRRIITTPIQKNRDPIKFTDYQSYCFYKTMQKQNIQGNMNFSKGSKMYAPQKIFYPAKSFNAPKTAVFVNRRDQYNSLKKNRFQFRKQNISIQESDKQMIPKFFIESLNSSRKFHTRTSYSKFPTSVR